MSKDNTSAGEDTHVNLDDTTTDIKFSTTTNSFSIRCGKCADIHNAQLDGKQSSPCECDCHKDNYQPFVNPYCPPQPYDPCCPVFPPQPIYCARIDTTRGADQGNYF